MKIFENYAILEGKQPAIVTEFMANTATGVTEDAGEDFKVAVTPKGRKNSVDFYPWGKGNNLPDQLIKYAYKNRSWRKRHAGTCFHCRETWKIKAYPAFALE